MIQVTKITGESYDLQSGEELPKSIVLSNGIRELAIHVQDEVIDQVLHMMHELEQARDDEARGPGAQGSLPSNVPIVQEMHVEQPEAVGVVKFKPVMNPPITAEDTSDGYDMTGDDENDPGEEYNDPSTGVASI